MSDRALRIGLPVLVLALGLLAWDLVVRAFAIPPFVLPEPGPGAGTLIADGGLLWTVAAGDARRPPSRASCSPRSAASASPSCSASRG